MQSSVPFADHADSATESLRVPPHSIEAEQSVLGGLMLDNTAWDQIADRISEADFYRSDHRLIFRAVNQLAERGSPFDVVTLAEWLEHNAQLDDAGGLAYLGVLARDTPSAANIRAYADIVRERSVLRQLIRVGTEIAASAYRPQGQDSKELLDEAEQKVFAIAEQGSRTRQGFVGIKELLTRAVDRIDTLFQQDNPITGVPTGWQDFDELTAGLQPGELAIIAGRPSMGKTTFAMNIAEHAAIKHRLPVAVFSMEMPGDQLAMRMMSSLGRIDQHRIRTGKLEDDDWPRLTSAVSILAEAALFIDDSTGLSPTEVRARARRLHREHGQLGLILIDYLQLMQVPGITENRATELSQISRALKSLAKELHVPVVALSQLNRSLEQRPNKRPVMSDLRECVTGDTLVQLTDGRRVPISELVGQQPEVWALGESGELVAARSNKVWSVGVHPLLRLTLASGRTLRLTARHRLYGVDGWIKAGALKPGDRIALARRVPEPVQPLQWPDHHVELLGQLVGDGSYLHHQPLRYTTASEENSALVASAAQAFSSTVTRYGGHGNWHQLVISGNGNRWHARGVGRWLKELGIFGQRSHEKRLPATVFQLSNRQIGLLLRHLWASDGCISVRGTNNKGSHQVFFSTCSEGLARDVGALLLRLGIVARLHTVLHSHYRPLYYVTIYDSEQQKLFLERVGAFGPRCEPAQHLMKVLENVDPNPNVDTLPRVLFDQVRAEMARQGISTRMMAALRGTAYGGTAHFRFSPSRKVLGEYAEILDDARLRRFCSDGLFWDRVIAIEPGGEEEVFDLSVPGPASWLADGIISHNSGALEQDADLICFIYRDEVYNSESTDKGIAEIIIGKQRNGPIGTVRLTFLGRYTRFENFAADSYEGAYP